MSTNTNRDDEREPFEGIRIELPFVTFHAGHGGWGWTMALNEEDAYKRARRRVRARLSFYRHLVTYVAVIAALFFISLVIAGHLVGFVLWVAGLWGALIVWQAFNTFVFPHLWSRETEERMIEEELRKERGE